MTGNPSHKHKKMSVLDAYTSLSRKVNKLTGNEDTIDNEEGVVSDLLPELELSMSDEDLIKLADDWEKKWDDSKVKTEWLEKCEEAEQYWLGNQYESKKSKKGQHPLIDNLIFESLETFLPQATKKDPEPVVELTSSTPDTPENLKFASEVEQKLADKADKIKLRLKLKKAARDWAIYLVGVAKVGWDMTEDDSTVKVIRPKRLILDPEGTIDEEGYSGDFIGEFRKMKASSLILICPKKKSFIEELVHDDMGTTVQFKEFWTDQSMFWKLGSEILLKRKNPHWNYDSTEEQEVTDDYGNTTMENKDIVGRNHFSAPKMPYIFLSIFNLGNQPVDNTSLITQNLPQQDLINKRLKQIDKNASRMNGGIVVSEERSGLTKDQAATVTEALANGGTIVIPQGSANDAIGQYNTNPLPPDVFNQLVDTRRRLSACFGTTGISPAGIAGEQTVRGKIITKGLDTDRIGGGITEYLEQFADDIYNWFVQLYYVYDEEFIGQDFPKLVVTVKEGSLLPKDNMTLANQAIDLAMAGKMSLVDLYTKLEYPNPEEVAVNVWLEANAPDILYTKDPRVQMVMQRIQQAQAQQEQQGEVKQQQEKQGKQQDEATKHERTKEIVNMKRSNKVNINNIK